MRGIIGLFMVMLTWPVAAQQLQPGQSVADFSLPAASTGWGQRLAEQRGQPVMLILSGRCDRCEERLAAYQLLAESHAADGLVSWILWPPKGRDEAPQMRIPVLINDAASAAARQFGNGPAVVLINRDGVLDQLISGNLNSHYDDTRQQLSRWLQTLSNRP